MKCQTMSLNQINQGGSGLLSVYVAMLAYARSEVNSIFQPASCLRTGAYLMIGIVCYATMVGAYTHPVVTLDRTRRRMIAFSKCPWFADPDWKLYCTGSTDQMCPFVAHIFGFNS